MRGLNEFVPEIVDHLGAMAIDLWRAADSLPISERALHTAHRGWLRCEKEPMLSACWQLNASVSDAVTRSGQFLQRTTTAVCKQAYCMMHFWDTPSIGYREVVVPTTHNSTRHGIH